MEPDPGQNFVRPANQKLELLHSVHNKGCRYSKKCLKRNKRSHCLPGFQFNVSQNACVGMYQHTQSLQALGAGGRERVMQFHIIDMKLYDFLIKDVAKLFLFLSRVFLAFFASFLTNDNL